MCKQLRTCLLVVAFLVPWITQAQTVPNCDTTLNETICYGEDYTENGFNEPNVQTSYVRRKLLTGTNGCDSLVTLNITVTPVYSNVAVADTICEGYDYSLNGFDIDSVLQSDVHTINPKTIHGCDSIVTLTLTMLPKSTTTLFDVVDRGTNYNKNGFDLPAVQKHGVHTLTLTAANGCDSIVTLDLVVNPTPTNLFDLVCFGSDYNRYGFHIDSVTYNLSDTLILQAADGIADSIVILHLITKPTYSVSLSDTICQGDDYREYGFGLTAVQATDVHTLVLNAINSCDSIVTLNLTVNPTYDVVFFDTVCYGDNYTKHGFNLTNVQTSLSDTLRLQTVNGCDSIVTLYLTVNPVYDIARAGVICQGGDFNMYDFEVPGAQEDTTLVKKLTSVNGCDSIVTLNLTVNSVYAVNFMDTICYGDDYTKHGFNQTNVQTSLSDTLRLQTVNGCDSIVTLDLIVNPVKSTTLYDIVLQGDDYDNYGFAFTDVQQNSSHIQDLETYLGCDSTVTLHLMMVPVYSVVINDTVCQGEDYNMYDFEVPDAQVSNTYTKHLHTINGTDSTVTLYLTVNPVYDIAIFDTVCQGEDYTKYDFTVPNAQTDDTVVKNLTSIYGCDSTVTLYLTVKTVYNTVIDTAICQGSDYNEYGFAFTDVQESLLDTLRLQTVSSCDNFMLNLTVNPVYNTVIDSAICQGSDFISNGLGVMNIQQDHELTLPLKTVNGCDSIITLNLTMNPTFEINLYDTVCQGESYNKYGFSLSKIQENMVLSQTLHSVNGCDSVVFLHLYVNTPYNIVTTDTVCQGEDYTMYGFNLTNVQESQVLTSTDACNNTTEVTLTVNPTYNTVINAAICQGSDYTENGFNLTNVQESGMHTQNLSTVNGCDSTITLNLTVNPTYEVVFFDTICQGSDYTENGFELENEMSSNMHTLNLTTMNGCDSTINLFLTVNPVYNTVINAAICQGSDYTENGFELTNVQESEVHTLSLTAANGCDSIVTLNLTVNTTINVTLSDIICQGNNFISNGFIVMNAQEDTTLVQNLSTVNGCDSTVTLNLTVNPVYEIVFFDTICQGNDYTENGFDLANLQESGAHSHYYTTLTGCDSTITVYITVIPVSATTLTASICQGSDYMENGFELTNVQESGVHTLNLTAANGCDSIVTLDLTVNMPAETTLEDAICQSSDYTENGFNLTNVQESGVHMLNLSTVNGCDSTVTLNLTVNPSYEVFITDSIAKGENYTANGFNLTNVQESGEHTLNLSTMNGCDSTITLNLIVFTVGINDVDAITFDAKLYPNPSSNVVTVSVEGLNSDAIVEVYDELGRLVMRQSMNAGKTKLRMNVSHLAAGAYNIRIRTEEGTVVRKLIVR